MFKEVHELQSVFIAEEQVSTRVRRELRSLFKEIESGKGRPWLEVRDR